MLNRLRISNRKSKFYSVPPQRVGSVKSLLLNKSLCSGLNPAKIWSFAMSKIKCNLRILRAHDKKLYREASRATIAPSQLLDVILANWYMIRPSDRKRKIKQTKLAA